MPACAILAALSSFWRRFRGDRRGSLGIELGFALPVLMVLSVGVIDFTRLVWFSATMTNVASEGARFAAVRGAEAQVPATAQNVIDFVLDQAVGFPPGALDVQVTWAPDNTPGNPVTVLLTHDYNFLIGPFIGLDPIELEEASSMVVL
jgi:Flp pilus assembly protein TadG